MADVELVPCWTGDWLSVLDCLDEAQALVAESAGAFFAGLRESREGVDSLPEWGETPLESLEAAKTASCTRLNAWLLEKATAMGIMPVAAPTAHLSPAQAELAGLEAVLCPPSPYLDDRDHQLALARFAFDRTQYRLLDLVEYVRFREASLEASATREGAERLRTEALSSCEQLMASMDIDETQEPWAASQAEFDAAIRPGLDAMHSGDCTGFAATCSRCLAESIYRLPSTVTWGDKAEGSRLEHRYLALRQELEEGPGSEAAPTGVSNQDCA